MKKMPIVLMAAMMLLTACGEDKHTTYTEEELYSMDNQQLESVLEQAAEEMAAAENTTSADSSDEVIELDVWSDAELVVKGTVARPQILVQYNGDDEYIREYIRYSSIGKCNNGTVVTVTASDTKGLPGYSIAQESKEFTVTGLSECIDNLDYDFSDIDKQINDIIMETVTDDLTVGKSVRIQTDVTDIWSGNTYIIDSINLYPKRRRLCYVKTELPSSSETYTIQNEYDLYYYADIKAHSEDGEVFEGEIYVQTYATNDIYVDSDGKLFSNYLNPFHTDNLIVAENFDIEAEMDKLFNTTAEYVFEDILR